MITRRIFAQALASIGLAAPALAKQAPAEQPKAAPEPQINHPIGIDARSGSIFYTGQGEPRPDHGEVGDIYIDMHSGAWHRLDGYWAYAGKLTP